MPKTVKEILQDPAFHALGPSEREFVLSEVDQKFASLDPAMKAGIIDIAYEDFSKSYAPAVTPTLPQPEAMGMFESRPTPTPTPDPFVSAPAGWAFPQTPAPAPEFGIPVTQQDMNAIPGGSVAPPPFSRNLPPVYLEGQQPFTQDELLQKAHAQHPARVLEAGAKSMGAGASSVTVGALGGGAQMIGAALEKLPDGGNPLDAVLNPQLQALGPQLREMGLSITDLNETVQQGLQIDNPNDWKQYWASVAGNGLGSMVGMMAGGGAASLAKLPAFVGGASAEALIASALTFNEAKKAGASDEDAAAAAGEVAATTAASSAVAGKFGVFNETLTNPIARAGAGALLEGGQEVLQGGGEDFAAQRYYDPNRKPFESAPESFVGGAFGGAVVSPFTGPTEAKPSKGKRLFDDVVRQYEDQIRAALDRGDKDKAWEITLQADDWMEKNRPGQQTPDAVVPDEVIPPDAPQRPLTTSIEVPPEISQQFEPLRPEPAPSVKSTDPPVQDQAAPPDYGFKDAFSNIGIADNLRDHLWDRFQKGKTTSAGGTDNILVAANAVRNKIKSREDFDSFTKRFYEKFAEGVAPREALEQADAEVFGIVPPVQEQAPPVSTEEVRPPVTDTPVATPENKNELRPLDQARAKLAEVEQLAATATDEVERADYAQQADRYRSVIAELELGVPEFDAPPTTPRFDTAQNTLKAEKEARQAEKEAQRAAKQKPTLPLGPPVESQPASDEVNEVATDATPQDVIAPQEKPAPAPSQPKLSKNGRMLKSGVKVGETYRAKVSGKLTNVKILEESTEGGWNGVNVATGKKVYIKTAGRLAPVLKGTPAQEKSGSFSDAKVDIPVENKPQTVEKQSTPGPVVENVGTSGAKTKLDLILDSVKAKQREVTFDTEGYTEEQRQRIVATAESRGLHVSGDNRWILVRDLSDTSSKAPSVKSTEAPALQDQVPSQQSTKESNNPDLPVSDTRDSRSEVATKPTDPNTVYFKKITQGRKLDREKGGQKLGDEQVELVEAKLIERGETTAKILLYGKEQNVKLDRLVFPEAPAVESKNEQGTKSQRNVPESRAPKGPVAKGKTRSLPIPRTNTRYSVQYEVRELSDLYPSHSGVTFEDTPGYMHKNERDYTKGSANQAKVVEYATTFDPDYFVNTNPDAETGPSIVDEDGNAMGGNGRLMILQRLYQNGEQGKTGRYRKALKDEAAAFGLSPEDIDRFQQPVLVRVMSSAEVDRLGASRVVSDLNKGGKQALSAAESAVADAKNVSPEALEYISGFLEDAGEDQSLNDVLNTSAGEKIINRLVDDGVIGAAELNRYRDTDGNLTTEGKDRVQGLLIGSLFRDSKQLDNTPKSIKSRLERVAGLIGAVKGNKDWDISSDLKDAIDLIQERTAEKIAAKAEGFKSVAKYRQHHKDNRGLGLGETAFKTDEDFSPRARMLADLLSGPARNVKPALKQYVEEFKIATSPTINMFAEPITPKDAFAQAFTKRDTEAGKVNMEFVAKIAAKLHGDNLDSVLDGMARVTEGLAGFPKSSVEFYRDTIAKPALVAYFNKKFEPIYKEGKKAEIRFQQLIDTLGAAADPYFSLSKKERKQLDPLLLEARRKKTRKINTAGLNERQIAAIQAVRDAMDKAHDLMLDLVVFRATNGQRSSAKDVKSLDDVKALLTETSEYTNNEELLNSRANAIWHAMGALRKSKRQGYVPLSRFGNKFVVVKGVVGYNVVVKDDMGNTQWSRRGKTEEEVQEKFEEYRKKNAEFFDDAGWTHKIKPIKKTVFHAKANTRFTLKRKLNRFKAENQEKFDKGLYVAGKIGDDIYAESDTKALGFGGFKVDLLIKSFENELGAEARALQEARNAKLATNSFKGSHMKPSKGTPGYEQNLIRPISDYITGVASYVSRAESLMRMTEYHGKIHERDVKMRNYATRYIDDFLKPQSQGAFVRGLVFHAGVGMMPSTALMNATQAPLLAVPWMIQHAKSADVHAQMARAYKDVTAAITIDRDNFIHINYDKLPADVRAAAKQALKDGELSAQRAMEMSMMARGVNPRGFTARFQQVSGYQFAATEHQGRLATFIAAYRLYDKGLVRTKEAKAFPSALKFAEQMVDDTFFEYGRHNRGLWERVQLGKFPAGAMMSALKSHVQNVYEMHMKLAHKAMASGDDELKKRAAMALMALAWRTVIAAGVYGLPLVGEITALWMAITALWGNPTDLTVEGYQRLKDMELGAMTFGLLDDDDVADVITHGASRLTPVDLHGSLATNELIPLRALTTGNLEDAAAPTSMLFAAAEALGKAASGDAKGALKSAPVKAIRAPAKAAITAQEGYKTSSGEKLIDKNLEDLKPGVVETLMMSGGFRSSRESDAYWRRYMSEYASNKKEPWRQGLVDEAVRMIDKGEDLTPVIDKLTKFNENLGPADSPIDINDFIDSVVAKKSGLDEPGIIQRLERIRKEDRAKGVEVLQGK